MLPLETLYKYFALVPSINIAPVLSLIAIPLPSILATKSLVWSGAPSVAT